ncbi:calcium-binding protein [uncultured Nocardioides sp.]|uniref:calcium-binding protein n=1 Tax=uncultured Nocardioides sp. TaxID=198441 RepID=UPI002623C6B2|nr:calcium-binding protein [uncultured Nocardioides sp.]
MSAVRRLRRLLAVGAVALAPAALLAGVGSAAATDGSASARGVPTCFGQRATIVATARGGALRGTPGDDVIVGRGGKDRIDGLGGTDRICGGGGKDRLTLTEPGMVDGGPGDDRILGSDGADRLAGGRDDDHISADGGDDVQVDGGPGDDLIDGGAGIDRLDGGPDDDDLYSGAGAGGNGLLDGQEGEDLLVAQAGGITLLGGPDDDEIRLGGGPDGSARGEDGDDTITGSDHADLIDGGEDTDTIDARGGDDVAVTGGPGRDRVVGGAGDDRLQGGPGTDVCDGGADDDTCDGGSPGTRGNSPTDPDRCTAEELISCRGAEPLHFTGTASGTRTADGVVETWTATFLTSPFGGDDSPLSQGPATITWRISGTDTGSGCTYEGSDSFEGLASIVVYGEPLNQYGVEIRPGAHSADVEVDCPLTPPETESWWALNGGVGQDLQELPADPTVLVGSESYEFDGYPGVFDDWRWNARRRD